jgi:hypothetical protein
MINFRESGKLTTQFSASAGEHFPQKVHWLTQLSAMGAQQIQRSALT